jgi:hypothetical protein
MKNISYLKLFFLLVFLAKNIFPGNLNSDFFYLDYGIFKGGDNNVIIEIYYSFDQKQLTFIKKDSGFEATGVINLKLTNINNNNLLFDNSYRIPVNIKDTSGYDFNNRLIGQVNLALNRVNIC